MKDWAKEIASFRERNRIKRKWLLIAAIWLSVWFISDSAHAADARLMLNLLACESGLQSDAHGDDGVSRGIAQFRKETFYEFADMAIKQKKWNYRKLGKPSWMNPQQQIFLLEWAIDNGYSNRWSCYRKLTKKGRK